MPDSSNTTLSFRVRHGLCVHRQRIVKIQTGRSAVSTAEVVSFGAPFGRDTVDLEPGEVKRYAHALEPTCEAGARALQALHRQAPPVATEDETPREARIVAAVVAKLIAAGALKFAKPAS
ncbi:MAG TPA: hypothetical protein VFF72_08345 [Caldimonas sp.]|nr:hypothetical protein [Caldimonas sp.]